MSIKISNLLFFFFLSTCLFAQGVDVNIVKLFALHQNGDSNQRLESPQINLFFLAKDIFHTPVGDSLQRADLELVTLFAKNNKIHKAERLSISGPESNKPRNFFAMNRAELDTGDYRMTLYVINRENGDTIQVNSREFQLRQLEDYDISEIFPLAQVSSEKSDKAQLPYHDFYIEYLPFEFVSKNLDEIHLYYEFLCPEKEEAILISETLFRLSGKGWENLGTKYRKLQNEELGAIHPRISRRDLSEMGSGEYKIQIQLIDAEKNALASQEYEFTRANPEKDKEILATEASYEYLDSFSLANLKYLLRATAIIAPQTETAIVNSLLSEPEIRGMRNYLYHFWANNSPANPEFAMKEYLTLAGKVDNTFNNGFGHGFETDRGRVFLQYGKPDDVVGSEQDIGAAPYEIWIYNKVEKQGQSNVRFVFYNPTLVENGMELIHSTAIGEIKNYQWERLIYSDAPAEEFDGPNHIEARSMKENTGRNAGRIYDSN